MDESLRERAGYNKIIMPPVLPPHSSPTTAGRPWYLDGLSALAFFAVALFLSKPVRNLLGPVAPLFFFLMTAGIGWQFAKIAWNDLLARRSSRGR